MSDRELIPNVNVTESSKLDSRSIRFLKDIFPDDLVDCSQLQEGGTLPNIDGYLDILCPDGTAREKVVVQVKHLTYPEKNGMYIMTFLSRFMHMQNDIKVNLSYLLLVIMSTKKFIGEILAKLQ